MPQKTICAVITTFNRIGLLENLLSDLREADKTINGKIKTIVVNDGSTDNTNNLIRSNFPEVTVINGTGDWWFTKSINEGIQKALEINPDYILTLNDDVRLPTEFTQRMDQILPLPKKTMLKCAEKNINNNEFTFLGGYIDLKFEKNYWLHTNKPAKENPNIDLLESNYAHTRGLLFPTSLINEVGLLDGRFLQYLGDIDFTLQAVKKGYRIQIYKSLYIYNNIELTGSTKFETKRSFRKGISRLTAPTSPAYLPSVVLFNWKNAKRGYFLIRTFIHAFKVSSGYFKRWNRQ